MKVEVEIEIVVEWMVYSGMKIWFDGGYFFLFFSM